MKISKLLPALLGLMLFLLVFAVPAAGEDAVPEFSASNTVCLVCGDADKNGKITAADARILLRVAVSLEEMNAGDAAKNDLDGDKKITAADARMVLRIAVELDPRPAHVSADRKTLQTASCLQTGISGRFCTRCGLYYDKGVTPRTDHKPGGWITEEAPTCASGGTEAVYCLTCGEKIDEKRIPQLEHIFDRAHPVFEEKEPDCTRLQYVSYSCILCGYEEHTIQRLADRHDFKWLTVAQPTCTAPGYEELRCTRCNTLCTDSDVKETFRLLPSLGGHEWAEIEDGDRTFFRCRKCRMEVETIPEE